MPRKVIGIAGGFRKSQTENTEEFYLWSEYFDAVESVGAVPVLIPPVRHDETLRELISRVDALILPGGPDTPPSRYGQQQHPETKLIHPRRDEFDFRFLDAVLKSGKPLLAICYGCQALNIHFGGTLIQHLPTVANHRRPSRPRPLHNVNVLPGTQLASVVGAGTLEVNSAHHQAIDQLGRGLRVSAMSEDKVIEGIELVDGRPVLAVQWHPEEIVARAQQAKLFEWLLSGTSQ